MNKKENEKPIPYRLGCDSIQKQKELKKKGETNSLRTKTCFYSMAKGKWRRMRNNSIWVKTFFHSMAKRT